MREINSIGPLLESVARLCGIAFQMRHDGRSVLCTSSFHRLADNADVKAIMENVADDCQPFHQVLRSQGPILCGVPLGMANGIHTWLIALAPAPFQGCLDKEVMPMLRSLTGMLEDHRGDQHEIDELALALDRSFEELALYRRIQKSICTGPVSSSEMFDLLSRLREILDADLVFGYFPASPELNVTLHDQALSKRVDIHAFAQDLVNKIMDGQTDAEVHHLIVNKSSADPVFAPLSRRPFRLMASRAVYNGNAYGWLGVVTFNFDTYFKRSHLNMVQAAAYRAALVGANNHLVESLERLTAQIKTFKKSLTVGQGKASSATAEGALASNGFFDEAFGNLSASIETTKTLMLRSAQMATMGQMAAVFAHEIKQPVCALDGFIQIAQLKQTDGEISDDLKQMAKSLQRLNHIIKRFDSFSRPVKPKRKPVSLNSITREVYQLVAPQLIYMQIEGRFQKDVDLPEIMGDDQGLQQAVLNLVSNAIAAMESNNGCGGKLLLKTYRNGPHACLDVMDNGPGIAEDLIEKIVEPYFTTKSPDKGTGLGLSVVADIVEQHNGRLEIESTPGKGSRFTMKIPIDARQH